MVDRRKRRGFPAVDAVPTIGDSPAFFPLEERARRQADGDRELTERITGPPPRLPSGGEMTPKSARAGRAEKALRGESGAKYTIHGPGDFAGLKRQRLRASSAALLRRESHSSPHRCSCSCKISTRFRPGAVAVGVRDDGVGFPAAMPASAGNGRHGLVGMERRVRSCGGRLRLGRPSGPSSRGPASGSSCRCRCRSLWKRS